MRTKRARPLPSTTRITVTFSDDAVTWLQQEADSRAVSVADLLRRIIDETRAAYIVPRSIRRRRI
jgi:hypothetical protein